MKLLIAAITFSATLGMLFLIEIGKSPKEDYARIAEALKEGDESAIALTTPPQTKARALIPTPTPIPIRSSAPSPTPPPVNPSPSPALSETPPPLSQKTGQSFINILSITSPVKQNSMAQLSISTLPDAQCSIKVILPSGNQSSAKELGSKTADVSGTAAWSWRINWNTTPGTANIDMACSKDGQSFSKSLQMTIIER